jgi:hypothetical protein
MYNIIAKTAAIYAIWISLHYLAAHLYVQICTPVGALGFIKSLYMTPTPCCYVLRWTIFHGGNNIGKIWLLMGVWILSQIPRVKV